LEDSNSVFYFALLFPSVILRFNLKEAPKTEIMPMDLRGTENFKEQYFALCKYDSILPLISTAN
jgi:hypothetical protein